MTVTHVKESDSVCKVCKMQTYAHIPHECDPTICRNCSGDKVVWESGTGWVGCDKCDGTGRIDFA